MTQPPDDAALVARLRDPVFGGRLGLIAEEAATALEAKDRRIAELEVLLADCVDDMSHCGGDGFNHEGGEPIIAARAALEPSDKGVG